MNLYFRLILVIVKALFRPRLDPLGESVLHFRVWPFDVDINGHMNNGRYLTLMDLGRTDLMMRTGMGRLVMQQKWMPVIASAKIRFRKSLLPFRKFTLQSRVLCWDEKWFFLEQRFVRDGRTVAYALVKGMLRKSGGYVAPGEIFERVLGRKVASPEMPAVVKEWIDFEDSIDID